MKKLVLLWLLIVPSWVLAADGVATTTLDNGLRVFVKPDHRAPVVTSQVWYKVGGSYEPTGKTGISHALEHMMFKGTESYKAGEFDQKVIAVGGQYNAFTSSDVTAYYEDVAKEHLDLVLQLEAERMRGLLISPDEFKSEKQVIKEERRMRYDDQPTGILNERFRAAAYINNPYRVPTIGWMNDIEQLTAKDLKAWYDKYYGPNNAVLVVVGDVEPEQVFAAAKKYFGNLSPITVPPATTVTEMPVLGEQKINVKVPATVSMMLLGFQVPSLKTSEDVKDSYALAVISALLSGSDSARFQKTLVRKNKVAAQAYTGYSVFARLPTLFTVSATPTDGTSIKKLRAALFKQLDNLKQEPVPEEELARIKAQLRAEQIYQQDALDGQAHIIGMLESVGLDYRDYDKFLAAMAKVTTADIQRVAKKYFTEDRYTMAVLRPIPIKSATQLPAAAITGGDNAIH